MVCDRARGWKARLGEFRTSLPGGVAGLDLAESPAVTRAVWASADTGTLVEYHQAGSDSTASALCEIHVCALDPERILPDLATFYRRFAKDLAVAAGGHYAVFVTGPSRTADVEQTLVLGAHGPRRLLIALGT